MVSAYVCTYKDAELTPQAALVLGLFVPSVCRRTLFWSCFASHPLFQFLYLSGSEAVGLGDQRNYINFVLQDLHELYIHWAKPTG